MSIDTEKHATEFNTHAMIKNLSAKQEYRDFFNLLKTSK